MPLEGNIRKRTITEERLLLNLMYAPEGTALYSLAMLISRLENLSHVLVWSKNASANAPSDQLTIDWVHLPRLKLTFTAKWDPVASEMRLYSLDHANMYISNTRNDLVTALCRGIPHSVFMCDPNQELRMLVPAINFMRPTINVAPFSTEVCPQEGMHWKGGGPPPPLQGAQPMPSHCPPDTKCQPQWHL